MKINRVITPKKFNELKSYFTISLSSNLNSKNKFKKHLSHLNLKTKTKLPKIAGKITNRLSKILEQIGKEDTIFNNNEKLITDVKIEPIVDSLQKNESILNNNMNHNKKKDDNKFYMDRTNKKYNSSLVNLRKNSKKKKYLRPERNKNKEIDISNNTLELNCNKMTYNMNNNNDINKFSNSNSLIKTTKINRSKQSTRTILHKNKMKNKNKKVEQFINKPMNKNNKNDNNINISLMNKISPIKSRKQNQNLQNSQRSLFLNNDTMSIAYHSKMDMSKSFIHQHHKSVQLPQKNNMHFPNNK